MRPRIDGHVTPVVPRRLLLLVGRFVLLVDDDQADVDSSGANTADRVPTTTSTSPRRMRCHWSWRSPADSPLCWMATRRPNRSPGRRPPRAGVSAISGTSTSTRRACVQHVRRQPQVHLGLAAARHAVQQHGPEPAASTAAFRASSADACSLGERPTGAALDVARVHCPAAGRVERVPLGHLLAQPHDAVRRRPSHDVARSARAQPVGPASAATGSAPKQIQQRTLPLGLRGGRRVGLGTRLDDRHRPECMRLAACAPPAASPRRARRRGHRRSTPPPTTPDRRRPAE